MKENMKKGFTLVELIGVVILLGMISAITIPPIVKQIKQSKNSLDLATEKLIITGTKNYLKNKKDDFPIINGNVYCITVGNLIDNNDLSNNLKDSDGNSLSRDEKIKVDVIDGDYKYEIDSDCIENK